MKILGIACCLLAGTCFLLSPAPAQEEPAVASGRGLFEKHCAVCHPAGGNVVNQNKTLRMQHLAEGGLNTADALVRYMLNPGTGMPRLVHENREITVQQARGIAAYILAELNGKAAIRAENERLSGRQLFEKYCVACHRDGGNMVNPKKTLRKKDRDANGIAAQDKLAAYMLNPGPGMPRLVHEDREITKEQALSIAAYIIETYNGHQ
jgi:cytochrome c6